MSRSEESVTLSEQDQQQHLLEEDHPNRLQLERKMKPMQQDEEDEEYTDDVDECDSNNNNDNTSHYDDNEHEQRDSASLSSSSSFKLQIAVKCILAGVLLYGSFLQVTTLSSSIVVGSPGAQQQQQQQQKVALDDYNNDVDRYQHDGRSSSSSSSSSPPPRRRLTAVMGDTIPSYMKTIMQDLKARKKLFDDTPPEEVKYWFEYTGPLQKYFYRFSRSRGKADYFEGRDDSGVTSSRFTDVFLGSTEHNTMFTNTVSKAGSNQHTMQYRLLENCLAMGSPARPDTTTPLWKEWYSGSNSNSGAAAPPRHVTYGVDRCRVLFTLNTVGAGRGTTMIWETAPPSLPHEQKPPQWESEQESAATHLQRQLEEIDAMCNTQQIAARVQILVCEPIAAKWTEWMDSLVPHCGGMISDLDKIDKKSVHVEERASPIQVVVVATVDSAETCHDLKSGFMERRTQDLILAPPYLGATEDEHGKPQGDISDPAIKRTHPDLVSSDDHDMYVGLKWTSLVTLRSLYSFLQASADMAAGASSPVNNKKGTSSNNGEDDEDDTATMISTAPSSPFLIPSFVRVSYVSEENAKVAKWRMHGDFFHPAAWEICKDSFEVTWIDHTLSGPGGVNGLCYDPSTQATMKRRLSDAAGEGSSSKSSTHECGQWWVYLTELQMPNSPDVYANEITQPIVQGGSNFVWMVTERQRREIVKRQICLYEASQEKDEKKSAKMERDCPVSPQAVVPLGDMESFLINYSPNTALGKKHIKGRRPGYSREKERDAERELVRERKQLKGQDDIEKALFDYTIYPAALFRKDATLKAARSRDDVLVASAEKKKKKSNKKDGEDDDEDSNFFGPKLIKSDYYDVTVTKPRPPVLGWCQAIARKGLCTLYGDYFRTSNDVRCLEACGMKKNFSKI